MPGNVWLQHGATGTEDTPLFTLSGSKAAPTLAVMEHWLRQLETQYQAKASTGSEAPYKSESSYPLASGDAVLEWLCDQDSTSPCTQTLPGRALAEVPGPQHVEAD